MIQEFMSNDHKNCDRIYAQLEEAVSREDWGAANSLWLDFWEHTLRHFEMEEKVLFPEFETATGMTTGPTAVMRMEHNQIRSVGTQLIECLRNRTREDFLGYGETMMVLLQQHNMKEEQILYPMAERSLADGTQVVERMKNV